MQKLHFKLVADEEDLYVYLAITEWAISAIIVRGATQHSIYYNHPDCSDIERNYTLIEKPT